MKKRIIALILACISCVTIFTACSRNVEPYTTTTEAETTTEPTTTEPETTEPTTTEPETTEAKKDNEYVVTTDLNVRAQANTVSEILGRIAKGETVEVIEIDENAWAKIIYNSKEAYVSSVYLKKVENNQLNEQAPVATGRKVVDPQAGNPYLVVVNMTREIPQGYEPELAEILDTGYYMEKGVTPFYEQMYLAAKQEGIILTPYSGYRSYERQENNYNNLTNTYMSRYGISREEAAAKAATVILPPGTSEHNLGLAMDICNTLDSFANTKEFAWLQNNAHKYGFILRYTAEKQSITGIVPEPWHWRFVGVEYAEKIKNSGLCLEEYLEKEGIDF